MLIYSGGYQSLCIRRERGVMWDWRSPALAPRNPCEPAQTNQWAEGMDHSRDTRVSVAHARFFKNHSPLISLLPSSHPTSQWISLQGPRFSEPNSITSFYTLPRTSSPHFSPIKHCRFPRKEVVKPAENSSEQLFFQCLSFIWAQIW